MKLLPSIGSGSGRAKIGFYGGQIPHSHAKTNKVAVIYGSGYIHMIKVHSD